MWQRACAKTKCDRDVTQKKHEKRDEEERENKGRRDRGKTGMRRRERIREGETEVRQE